MLQPIGSRRRAEEWGGEKGEGILLNGGSGKKKNRACPVTYLLPSYGHDKDQKNKGGRPEEKIRRN